MKNEYRIMGDKTIIFLNRKDGGKLQAIISTVDLERVKELEHSWTASYSAMTKSYYVSGYLGVKNKKQYCVRLHNWIIGKVDEGCVVDHINHDTLDNSRDNLRVVTYSVNQLNKHVRGVYYNSALKKWHARIQINGKRKSLGLYDDEETAMKVVALERERAINTA